MNRYNREKYDDPTVYSALTNLSEEEIRCSNLIRTLKYIISLAGFDLVNRIELREKDSGRVYK